MKRAQMRPSGRRGSYKPEQVRTRVLAKKIAGKTNRQIAREERIDRHTVGRILGETKFREIANIHRQELLGLISESIKVLELALKRAHEEKDRWGHRKAARRAGGSNTAAAARMTRCPRRLKASAKPTLG